MTDSIPLIDRASRNPDRTAILADGGRLSYRQLLAHSASAASVLLDGRKDLGADRVAFLVPPGSDYVVAQWGVWRAGGVAVPLCTQHPEPELDFVIDDAQAQTLIASPDMADRLRPIARRRSLRLLLTTELNAHAEATAPGSAPGSAVGTLPGALPGVDPARPAMIVYTSGTTSKPKGVVSTHDILTAQITSLTEAWGWRPDDHILEVLPLHHLHGILNVVCCALWSGAVCEMMPMFDARRVWERFGDPAGPTLFMAVPTIYTRLIRAWEEADEQTRQAMSAGCRRLRLMVCGSAALPVTTLEQWRRISGHTLLERYGMTEMGMCLSNPLDFRGRRPGCVGSPLPRVTVRLMDEHGQEVQDGQPGEIQVRGPNVFREYWRRPEATAQAFTADGWFRTGDVAVREQGVYRILGRQSVDIIKTGGYKVSALEIEAVLRTHGSISDCAVVGVEDAEWGQRVAAAVICRPDEPIELEALRAWAKQRLAVYKIPSLLCVVDDLPRNPMGKVTKPAVVLLFEPAAKEPVAP